MSDVSLKFRVQKFENFFDRETAKQIDPTLNRFLRWSGSDVRRAARRSLKVKRKTLGEMTDEERESFRQRQKAYKENRTQVKPQKPKATAKPGEPPRLQFTPNPLRDQGTGILFTLDDGGQSVVVGPSPFGENDAEQIEDRYPFMKPALQQVLPTLPSILKRAAAR